MAGVKPKVNGEIKRGRGGRRARRKILPRIAATAALGVLFLAAAVAASTTVAAPTTTAVTPAAPTTSAGGSSRYFNPYTPTSGAANKTPTNPTDPPGQWEVYPSPTTVTLYAVDFVDANNGWAVGHDLSYVKGVILRYQSGTWSVFYQDTTHAFQDIDMVSANDGWLVCFDLYADEAEIWHWDGSNWTVFQKPGGTLYCIDMIDPNHGWIGDNPAFFRFNGSSWVTDGSAPDTVFDIQMNSDTDGRAAGFHSIMRRTGTAWAQEANDSTWNLGHLFVVDNSTAWAGGQYLTTSRGLILKYNGTWTVNKIFADIRMIYPIWAFVDGTAWTSGYRNTSPPWGGALLYFDKTEWVEVTNPDPNQNEMHAFYFFDKETGWAVGRGGVILKYKPNIDIKYASLGEIKALYR